MDHYILRKLKIFSKYNDENKKIFDFFILTICNGTSYEFDKVFFTKKFIETIPEINQEKIITDNNNIELAPNIINLENNKKFDDNEYNIIKIETMEERTIDGWDLF